MEDAILECGGADLGIVSRPQPRELAQERSMTVRRLALQASLALDHKRRTPQGRTACWTTPSGFDHVERMQPRNQQTLFGTRAWSSATRWPQFGSPTAVPLSSQVRPFHDDDEAAHEHLTEHMTDLGERLLHEGDFSYEDITGQDEPPVDSPLAQGENTATRPPGPNCEGQIDVDPRSAKTNERKNPTHQP